MTHLTPGDAGSLRGGAARTASKAAIGFKADMAGIPDDSKLRHGTPPLRLRRRGQHTGVSVALLTGLGETPASRWYLSSRALKRELSLWSSCERARTATESSVFLFFFLFPAPISRALICSRGCPPSPKTRRRVLTTFWVTEIS